MRSAQSLVVQDRDIDLLRELLESRLVTLSQAADIVFRGKREAAKKRLQRLKAAGFIGHRDRRPDEPATIFLTNRGISVLIDRGILAKYGDIRTPVTKRAHVSPLTLRHERQVMGIKAAFYSAARKAGKLSIVKFTTWPKLCEFRTRDAKGRRFTLKPDGYASLQESPHSGRIIHDLFLELDRSTESLATLIAKAEGYLEHYRSGGYAKTRGVSPDRYKACPFRILMVVQSKERSVNVRRRLLNNKPPIRTQVYVGTFSEVIEDPLGAVWRRPVDSEPKPAISLTTAAHQGLPGRIE